MITDNENRKQLIDFLLRRWHGIAYFAATEKVFDAMCRFMQENNLPLPKAPPIMMPQACRQIEIIKQHIIAILPEVNFIDYDYEAQVPLDPNDFAEVFIADHYQCIGKVQEVVKKMKIE